MSQPALRGLPYLGYPYVNPPVIDPPSLNPAEVAAMQRWHNLPRRPVRTNDGAGSSGVGGSSVVSDAVAVQGSSGSKEDLEEQPVIYIDIPDSTASGVSQTMEQEEPSYVQETILYDPFKDRRISIHRESDSESEGSPTRPGRPQPPTHLNLASPGSSSGYNSMRTPPNVFPSFLSKEAYVYGRQPSPDDGFPLSPIPVSDFPAPPPAYEEIQGTRDPPRQLSPTIETTVITEQPRTQVIMSPGLSPETMVFDENRKVVSCQHCGSTVQTLVVKQNGFWTHILGAFICLVFIPMVPVVYCTDYFKYKNHYCPRCNKKIGFGNPVCCESGITFV